jgi:hypothetical protein
MTKEQKRVLFHKHCTGEFPGQKWSTIVALLKAGMLLVHDGKITVSEKGKTFCDENHMVMP